jgi:hypothetical protein
MSRFGLSALLVQKLRAWVLHYKLIIIIIAQVRHMFALEPDPIHASLHGGLSDQCVLVLGFLWDRWDGSERISKENHRETIGKWRKP